MKPLRQSTGQINLLLALAIFFGIGTLLFGGLSIYAWDAKTKAETDRNAQVNVAVTKAVGIQKQLDATANAKANELPYRTYTAPSAYGGFSLNVPKNWSIYADQNLKANPQLTLVSSLDAVTIDQGAKNLQPFKLDLIPESTSAVQKEYQNQYSIPLKKKEMTTENVTVSGIAAVKYTGKFDKDQPVNTVRILVPVRDKTMIFSNEDLRYATQFNQILNSAKITP